MSWDVVGFSRAWSDAINLGNLIERIRRKHLLSDEYDVDVADVSVVYVMGV